MDSKRFTLFNSRFTGDICLDDKLHKVNNVRIHDENDAQAVVNELNRLYDENQMLKKDKQKNEDNIMKEVRNDDYVTELFSYDKDNNRVLTRVSIKTKNYDVFCGVVEAVSDVLKRECGD